jgi:tetratricopeptide (TPR) repeat protein
MPRWIAVAFLAIGILGGGVMLKSTASRGVQSANVTAPLFAAGITAQQQGNLKLAANEYRSILAMQPNNKLAHYDLGTIYQQQGNTEGAYLAYERTLLIDPTYVPALYNLATLVTSSSPTAAIKLYQRIEQLNPTNARAAFNLAAIYASEGKNDLAKAQYATAVHIEPSLVALVPAGL